MKSLRMECIGPRRDRSTSWLGRRWDLRLGFALTVFALASGCKNAEDECNTDATDCESAPPSSWVEYDVYSGDDADVAHLRVEQDGRYRMRLDGGSNALCMSGQLDDDQLAAVEAVRQGDLMDTYLLDDVLSNASNGSGSIDRVVAFEPIDEENEGGYFALNSEGTLQPETAVLIDTLDGISLDLYERAEYCTEGDRALAAKGDWVFPISE